MAETEGARDPHDESPLVQIIAWLLVAVFTTSWLMRVMVRIHRFGNVLVDWGWSDSLLVASMAVAIAQSGATHAEAARGLGREASSLSTSAIESSLQAGYAADALYICALALAKLSAIALYRSILPAGSQRRWAYYLDGIVSAWAASGVLVSLFQCSLPRPWDFLHSHCIDRRAWWTSFEALNIVTDLVLVTLPCILILSKLQISTTRKAGLCAGFAVRLSVVAACACKIYFWNKPVVAGDSFWHLWPIAVCNSTIQGLAITTICLMHFRQFTSMLETGFLSNEDAWRRRESDVTNHTSSAGVPPQKPSRLGSSALGGSETNGRRVHVENWEMNNL